MRRLSKKRHVLSSRYMPQKAYLSQRSQNWLKKLRIFKFNNLRSTNKEHKNDDRELHQNALNVVSKIIRELAVQIWLNSLDIEFHVWLKYASLNCQELVGWAVRLRSTLAYLMIGSGKAKECNGNSDFEYYCIQSHYHVFWRVLLVLLVVFCQVTDQTLISLLLDRLPPSSFSIYPQSFKSYGGFVHGSFFHSQTTRTSFSWQWINIFDEPRGNTCHLFNTFSGWSGNAHSCVLWVIEW